MPYDPDFQDFLDERIKAALEERKIQIEDLPVAQLSDTLNRGMLPDGDTFLLAHSVGPDSLDRPYMEKLPALATGKRLVFDGGQTGSIFVAGGAETNAGTISHNLGVVPVSVVIADWFEDAGRWSSYVRRDLPPTSTTIPWFARDMAGGAHGPGNLTGSWWMAFGII